MLLNAYKALFSLLKRDHEGASNSFKQAHSNHTGLANDVA